MADCLLPLITPSVDPCASEKGIQGHGEGVDYGTGTGGRPLTYYYRFAGKKIPRDKVAYVTAEDGYFSRAVGDRHQLILAYEEQAQGFRVIEKLSANSGMFKETFAKYKDLSPEKAIEVANNKAIEDKRFADDLQAAIERGDDIF